AQFPVESVKRFSRDCLKIAVQNAVGFPASLDAPASLCISLHLPDATKSMTLRQRGQTERYGETGLDEGEQMF
ncbi:MAG: hypothetical protein J7482_21260, partial [Roseiflexus sp.]|nr:hypothetical protein [Roseiflexus sp.]